MCSQIFLACKLWCESIEYFGAFATTSQRLSIHNTAPFATVFAVIYRRSLRSTILGVGACNQIVCSVGSQKEKDILHLQTAPVSQLQSRCLEECSRFITQKLEKCISQSSLIKPAHSAFAEPNCVGGLPWKRVGTTKSDQGELYKKADKLRD